MDDQRRGGAPEGDQLAPVDPGLVERLGTLGLRALAGLALIPLVVVLAGLTGAGIAASRAAAVLEGPRDRRSPRPRRDHSTAMLRGRA